MAKFSLPRTSCSTSCAHLLTSASVLHRRRDGATGTPHFTSVSRSSSCVSNGKRFFVRGDRVAEETERTRSRDRGVELAETPSRCVSGIREERVTGARTLLVHLLEAVEWKIDLAADCDSLGRCRVGETKRDVSHRAQIHGHVLADDAVAARRPRHQQPVLVRETDRDAVYLELRHIARFRYVVAGDSNQPLLPGEQLIVAERVSRATASA